MIDYSGIKTFDELIEREHGKIGTESRNGYEEKAQMFIVSEMLKEARKEANMTQQELAEKAGVWEKVKSFSNKSSTTKLVVRKSS